MRFLRLFLLFALLVAGVVIGYRFNVDLIILHHKATLLHSDLSRIYDFTERPGPYFYGPISLVMIYPLGALSYDAAKIVWLLAQCLAYVVFWRNLSRLYPWLEQNFALWFLIWIVAINGIHNNFQSNNIGLMLAAALVAGEYHARRGNWWGGCLVALAAAVKVFPLFIAAYYLVARPRAVKLGVVAGFLIAGLVPLAVFGVSAGESLFVGFFRSLTTYSDANPWTTHEILCLPSLVHRLVPESAAGLVSMASVGVVALAFFHAAFWWTRGDSLGFWALAMALMTVLNPSTRPHYFVFLVPAFCSLVEVLRERRVGAGLIAATVLTTILVAFTTEGVVGKTFNNQLEDWSVPTVGMLLLCATLAVALWRARKLKTATSVMRNAGKLHSAI